MPRRNGATMIEVLVAIFIMGIGLMALLTLFPLGAFKMAEAIQKEKAAQAGGNGASVANLNLPNSNPLNPPGALWKFRNDPAVTWALINGPTVGSLGPITNTEGRSYPVFVDSLGILTTNGAVALGGTFVAGTPLLPRVMPWAVNYPTAGTVRQAALRWFTMPDDMSFEAVYDPAAVPPQYPGYPKVIVPGTVERDYRYSWAYVVQRPRAAEASVTELTVVVYGGRGMSLTGNLTLPEANFDGWDNARSLSEAAYVQTGNPSAGPDPAKPYGGPNTVRIRYEYFGHFLPQVRAGGWILDLSLVKSEIHAYFHRVTGVTEGTEVIGGSAYAYVDLEVQQPFRGFPVPNGVTAASDPFVGPSAGFLGDRARVVILDGVVEVFEKGISGSP